MKALLSLAGPTGKEERIGVIEREPVVHSVSDIETTGRVWDLKDRSEPFSLYFQNQAVEATTPEAEVALELLDSTDAVVQRQVVYPERAYVLPVPTSVTKVRATNPTAQAIPVIIIVF